MNKVLILCLLGVSIFAQQIIYLNTEDYYTSYLPVVYQIMQESGIEFRETFVPRDPRKAYIELKKLIKTQKGIVFGPMFSDLAVMVYQLRGESNLKNLCFVSPLVGIEVFKDLPCAFVVFPSSRQLSLIIAAFLNSHDFKNVAVIADLFFPYMQDVACRLHSLVPNLKIYNLLVRDEADPQMLACLINRLRKHDMVVLLYPYAGLVGKFENTLYALPVFGEYYTLKGYRVVVIPTKELKEAAAKYENTRFRTVVYSTLISTKIIKMLQAGIVPLEQYGQKIRSREVVWKLAILAPNDIIILQGEF